MWAEKRTVEHVRWLHDAEKWIVRVTGGNIAVVSRATSDVDVDQSRFLLETDGPRAEWRWEQGYLHPGNIPDSIWRDVWACANAC